MGKPRVLAVKEKKLEERAPPSNKEYCFLETHEPKHHRKKTQQ